MIDRWRKRLKGREGFVVVGLVALGMGGMLFLDVARDAIGVLVPCPVGSIGDRTRHGAASERHPQTASHEWPLVHAGRPFPDGPFVVRSILPIDGPIRFGQFYWDESKGEPGRW
jgi:hypothetical protein